MIEINDTNINLRDLENKNFPIKINDKVFWISRSVAVCTFVFKKIGNEICVLAEKRGKGAADFHGKYCSPCGYVDYNENLVNAALRELKEETGFVGNFNKMLFFKINSSPLQNRQNISVHFVYFADEDEDFNVSNAIGGEDNEIESVQWLKCGEITKNNFVKSIFKNNKKRTIILYNNLNKNYDWAFNHNIIIESILKSYYNIKGGY